MLWGRSKTDCGYRYFYAAALSKSIFTILYLPVCGVPCVLVTRKRSVSVWACKHNIYITFYDFQYFKRQKKDFVSGILQIFVFIQFQFIYRIFPLQIVQHVLASKRQTNCDKCPSSSYQTSNIFSLLPEETRSVFICICLLRVWN